MAAAERRTRVGRTPPHLSPAPPPPVRKDTRTYIRVHDGIDEHPKMEALSDAAFRAVISLWAWSSRNKRDGLIPYPTWNRRVSPDVQVELLTVQPGETYALAEEVPNGVQMHDYLRHQDSAVEIANKRAAKVRAGQKGGLSKAARTRQMDGEPPADYLAEV